MNPTNARRYPSLLKPLLVIFVAAVLTLVFIVLGSEVGEGDTRFFDTQVLVRAQALRADHLWLAQAMRDLSGLGSMVVLTLFTVATVGYLGLISQKMTALLVATSVTSGTILVSVFKATFARLRPDAGYAELAAYGFSFPSGHASMSAIVFLTLGALVASSHDRIAERLYILMAAALMSLLVGLSRVALGLHYATDVLAGWAFGSAWAMAWMLLAHPIQNARVAYLR